MWGHTWPTMRALACCSAAAAASAPLEGNAASHDRQALIAAHTPTAFHRLVVFRPRRDTIWLHSISPESPASSRHRSRANWSAGRCEGGPPPGAMTRARHGPRLVVDSAQRGCGQVTHKDGTVKARRESHSKNKAAQSQRLPKKLYETELYRLQAELVKVQEWVRTEQARVVVIFEGRDAAGKGSTIKRVAQYLNPRLARITALPAPTEREQTQWYFQRFIEHLPAAGQIVLFDRSWYNRAGVEHVMGFCTKQEYHRFLHQCPIFERLLAEDGVLLRKYWFSVSDAEQQARFRSRLEDPMRRWKLSPMDLESITRWEDYSRAKDEMFIHTDIPEAGV